jgi:hypothetical protein
MQVEDNILLQATKASLISLGKRNQFTNEVDRKTTKHDAAYVGASIGSNNGFDSLVEDLTRDRESRETGYVGQASEVQWLRNVKRRMQHIEAESDAPTYELSSSVRVDKRAQSDAPHKCTVQAWQGSRQGSSEHVTDTSFYLDSSDIAADFFVNPYEIPNPETAEQLFNCYINTVHSSFPLVRVNINVLYARGILTSYVTVQVPAGFKDQFRRYIESVRHDQAFDVSDRWRAQLNLLLAIGAKYSHLIGTEWRGDECDHQNYMMRALYLIGSESTSMAFSRPDLELVQAVSSPCTTFQAVPFFELTQRITD